MKPLNKEKINYFSF